MIDRKMRVAAIGVIFGIVFAIFVFRLVNLQLVNGESYLEQSQSSVVRKISVTAPRGEILDRDLLPIVSNRSAFVVTLNLNLIDDINGVILTLVDLFETCGQEYTDTFPISKSEPYVFDSAMLESERARNNFDAYLKKAKTSTSKTADEAIAALIKYYKLSDYTLEDARKIIAVRYEIYLRAENSYFTFAEDVNLSAATAVREAGTELQGVYLEETFVRYYTEEYFASHIVGYVGKIYSEEYDTYKAQGYSMNDIIGKEGIEKVYESYLKGEKGYKYTVTDSTGATIEIIENLDPKIGNDVVLTLSSNMQKLTEEGIATAVAKLKAQNGDDAATSASAVFMDIDTGEILAMASYPTYNLGTYNADYAENASNPDKPFLNRAIAGLFPLGSTYKMVAGVAGLETGLITASSSYKCEGIYTYFKDYTPVCFNSRAHGQVNVRTALKFSCNVFFYDVGRQLGIDTLNYYSKMLGFGQKNGIELLGERAGIVAGREYRESQGKSWEAQETLTAVIGQSDNAGTPLQLCNYIATIANGGKLMEPHIVKSIRNNQTGESVYETQPKVISDLELDSKTVKAILEGLVMVTEEGGTAYSGFKNFDDVVQVAVKTGTAEMPSGQPTALLVGVAPADDPQIAFSIVVENGGLNATNALAQCIKDVLIYYFDDLGDSDMLKPEGELVP